MTAKVGRDLMEGTIAVVLSRRNKLIMSSGY